MRFFSAIPLPDLLKKKVSEIMTGRLPVPYINTTNLHVTLNFFDDLDTDDSDKLLSIFQESVKDQSGFEIVFDQIINHRNQIHVTLKPNLELSKLQKEMENYFLSKGFQFQNRIYYPHMKLANMHMDNVMNRQRKLRDFPNELLAQLNFRAE